MFTIRRIYIIIFFYFVWKLVMKRKLLELGYLSGIIFVILALLCIVGRFDFEDESAAFKQYCVDVSNGVYPDYKKQIDYCD